MRLRIKPGPRPGWGRVDLPRAYADKYLVKGMVLTVTRIGRLQQPCLVFPLSKGLRVGDEVEVEEVLRCKICGGWATALINGLCDDCYQYIMIGDAVSPPLAAVQTAAGEGEDSRPQRRIHFIR